MNIHILSDLHNELTPYHAVPMQCDLVILAGDIHVGTQGIVWARQQWPDKQIIYIAGNHEFYRLDRRQTLEALRVTADQQGVDFLDNDCLEIGNYRFLGCTLWTDFALYGDNQIEHCMEIARFELNDFRVITEDYERFTPQSSLTLHRQSVEWLTTKLEEPFDGKTIVVTHHAPSWQSIEAKYQEDYLSACFASRLDKLVEKADLWIHGHTHCSFDYTIGRGRLISNPRGYMMLKEPENSAFNPRFAIEL